MATLDKVTFVYTKIQQPGLKYGTTDEYIWSVDCVVTKAQAKEWNKTFQKQKAKVVDNEDFEGIYKIPPVHADQDEQYIIALKQPTTFPDGMPVPDARRPKVYQKNANGRLSDVTMTKLVGNGSVGAAEYSVRSNDFGTFAKLANIRVDSLVEYTVAGGTSLGEVEQGEATELGDNTVPVKQEAKPKPKAKAKPAPAEEADSFDDDIPF